MNGLFAGIWIQFRKSSSVPAANAHSGTRPQNRPVPSSMALFRLHGQVVKFQVLVFQAGVGTIAVRPRQRLYLHAGLPGTARFGGITNVTMNEGWLAIRLPPVMLTSTTLPRGENPGPAPGGAMSGSARKDDESSSPVKLPVPLVTELETTCPFPFVAELAQLVPVQTARSLTTLNAPLSYGGAFNVSGAPTVALSA